MQNLKIKKYKNKNKNNIFYPNYRYFQLYYIFQLIFYT